MKEKNKNNVKQVVLVRTDLNMSVGKIASQVAHACMSVFFQKLVKTNDDINISFNNPDYYIVQHSKYFDEYIEGAFKKVVLAVDSEKQLLDLYQKAKAKNIHCSLIRDSGLTEFNLVPTYTTVCIGPWLDSEIDKITGNLKLLK